MLPGDSEELVVLQSVQLKVLYVLVLVPDHTGNDILVLAVPNTSFYAHDCNS